MIKPITEFETFILENVNYERISKMTFDEYKGFVYDIFSKLNVWRNNGLKREDVMSFVNEHYYNTLSSGAEQDVLFVRRFESVIEEIYGGHHNFWSTTFGIYMEKWEKEFVIDW
jgi:hypothetical protein